MRKQYIKRKPRSGAAPRLNSYGRLRDGHDGEGLAIQSVAASAIDYLWGWQGHHQLAAAGEEGALADLNFVQKVPRKNQEIVSLGAGFGF